MANTADQFRGQLSAAMRSTQQRINDTVFIAVSEVRRSIVQGSTLTGAPGQPVDTNTLRKSWTQRRLSARLWEVSTPVPYSVYVEEGGTTRGRMQLRSVVGGFHSVALTRTGWDRIVAYARERARSGRRP
jgi:hypothetical protein